VAQPPGHPALHGGEAVPAAQREPAPAGGGRQLGRAVDLHRVVHGRHERPVQAEHAVAEALVVVHHVVAAAPQRPAGAQRERQRLREAGGHHHADLGHVDPVAVLLAAGHPERVRFAVQVEAGHLDQAHARVEHRVRRAGEHVDLVS
jgi:hypothetical protein